MRTASSHISWFSQCTWNQLILTGHLARIYSWGLELWPTNERLSKQDAARTPNSEKCRQLLLLSSWFPLTKALNSSHPRAQLHNSNQTMFNCKSQNAMVQNSSRYITKVILAYLFTKCSQSNTPKLGNGQQLPCKWGEKSMWVHTCDSSSQGAVAVVVWWWW